MNADWVSTGSTDDSTPVDTPPLLLRVVKGDPTADELAALVALVAARRSAASASVAETDSRRSGWTSRARGHRGIHRHGPDGWRRAGLPR